jgi:hypothetical protein
VCVLGFCKATSNYALKPRNGINIIFEMIASFRGNRRTLNPMEEYVSNNPKGFP